MADRQLPEGVEDVREVMYRSGPHITQEQGYAMINSDIMAKLEYGIIQDIYLARNEDPDNILLEQQDDFLRALLFSLKYIKKYAQGELYTLYKKELFPLTDADLSTRADGKGYSVKDCEGENMGITTHHLRKEKLILNLQNVVLLFSQDGRPVEEPIRKLTKEIVDIFEIDLPIDFPHRASILSTKTTDGPSAGAGRVA